MSGFCFIFHINRPLALITQTTLKVEPLYFKDKKEQTEIKAPGSRSEGSMFLSFLKEDEHSIMINKWRSTHYKNNLSAQNCACHHNEYAKGMHESHMTPLMLLCLQLEDNAVLFKAKQHHPQKFEKTSKLLTSLLSYHLLLKSPKVLTCLNLFKNLL